METAKTPDGVYMKLSRDLMLRNIDFELTDYEGNIASLRRRPLSFETRFDYIPGAIKFNIPLLKCRSI